MDFIAIIVEWAKWIVWDTWFGIVKDIVMRGPSFTILPGVAIGGWEGKHDADICAAKTGNPASFWQQ